MFGNADTPRARQGKACSHPGLRGTLCPAGESDKCAAIPARSVMNTRRPQRPPYTRRAFVAGLLLTLGSFMSILKTTRPFLSSSEPKARTALDVSTEAVRYVTAAPRTTAPVPNARRATFIVPHHPTDSTASRQVPDVVVSPTESAQPPTAPSAALAPQASRLSLPTPSWRTPDYTRPNGGKEVAGPRAPLTAAERDSANRAFARAAAARVPSPEEKDSILQAMQRPGTIPGRRAGEQGGGGGVGGSMDVPIALFTPGPSRAERKRDSLALAENLERLARLRARMEAKRDSTPRPEDD